MAFFQRDDVITRHDMYSFITTQIPRQHWLTATDEMGIDLMYFALLSRDRKAVALLIKEGYKVRRNHLHSPTCRQTNSILRILISQGVKPEFSAIGLNDEEMVYHGVIPHGYEHKDKRLQFTSCRHVVVILLALKRRRIQRMIHLDRFLMRELCFSVWITRYVWPIPKNRECPYGIFLVFIFVFYIFTLFYLDEIQAIQEQFYRNVLGFRLE